MIKFTLPSAVSFKSISNLIKVASQSPAEGCFVEVGVYKGGTALHLSKLAKNQNREIFLYDTFCGIPFQSEIDKHKIGDFKDTDFNLIKSKLKSAKIIKGIFPQSAVNMPPISFVHLDVDQYKSYFDSISYFIPRMKKNGIIWIDDYKLLEGCRKAVNELIGFKNLTISEGQAYTIIN